MADPTPLDIGHMIRSRRIVLGLSQARLGALVDRTATTIRRWERGEVVPPDESLDALASALEIDVADLRPQPDPGPATVVVSSPLTPPSAQTPAPPPKAPADPPVPAPKHPAEPAPTPEEAAKDEPPPSEEPPTIVQPAAAEPDRPRPDRPPARPEPPASAPPARPPPRPAEVTPLRPGSTDREDAEPWIHFETEAISPPPPAVPPAPVLPPVEVPLSAQPTQEVASPPPPMPQPRVQVVQPKSYLEDPKQRVLYAIRMLLTLAFLAVMAVVLVWAVGEFVSVMSDALDLFSDTTEATTPAPAPTP